MPLLDHFHPPLTPTRQWVSFHTNWIVALVRLLNNGLLPQGYFAEANVTVRGPVQPDVATLEGTNGSPSYQGANSLSGGVPTAVWTAPTPTCVFGAVFPAEFEVRVLSTSGGASLVAVVELVSPSNKDRPETRRAFAAKCAAYLQIGVGVVVVDVVTERHANLHNELMAQLELPEALHIPGPPALYAVGYRPARRKEKDEVDCWQATLTVGTQLPTMPLALLNGPTLPLDLESTYMEARGFSGL